MVVFEQVNFDGKSKAFTRRGMLFLLKRSSTSDSTLVILAKLNLE